MIGAIHIQKQNTDAHRIKSRPISATDTLARILEKQERSTLSFYGVKKMQV